MSMFTASKTGLYDRIDIATSEDLSPFSRHVLVYYVPGNPGIIEYYDNYLAELAKYLEEQRGRGEYAKHRTEFHICGTNLLGFEWSSAARRASRQATGKSGPYNLTDIKWHLIKNIQQQVAELASRYNVDQSQIPVILIGHSIGTWLILETVEWAQNARRNQSRNNQSSMSESVLDIAGGILLFPTVVDIAKSPNGVRAGWILRLDWSALIVSVIARVLMFFIPMFFLIKIVQIFAGMPYDPAWITATWLKNNRIVRQALHMAHHEINEVNEDTWSDTVWSVNASTTDIPHPEAVVEKAIEVIGNDDKRTQLFFYWGVDDHWISRPVRDKLIAERARTGPSKDDRRPIMELDLHGLPHAFSITSRGARLIAERTATWIKDLVADLPAH